MNNLREDAALTFLFGFFKILELFSYELLHLLGK